MRRRITITLPEETIRLIDRLAGKGNRSQFIESAIKPYIRGTSRRKLRQALKEGALRRARHDLRLAAEWFALDDA